MSSLIQQYLLTGRWSVLLKKGRIPFMGHFIQHSEQHRFLISRSCTIQLLIANEIQTEALQHGLPVDVIYLKKAFLLVPHAKLKAYGISGRLLDWIQSFLTNCKQGVLPNGIPSLKTEVLRGILYLNGLCQDQSLLFQIFVNDIPATLCYLLKTLNFCQL